MFRTSGHEDHFAGAIERLGISDLVDFRLPVGYREALSEMNDADVLLVMQAENSNFQIPAKTYEYFRIGRPLLGLVDLNGDTAKLLHDAGVEWIASINFVAEIKVALHAILKAERQGQLVSRVPVESLVSFSRDVASKKLLDVLQAFMS